jgi:hypothetical protein
MVNTAEYRYSESRKTDCCTQDFTVSMRNKKEHSREIGQQRQVSRNVIAATGVKEFLFPNNDSFQKSQH